MTLGLLTLHLVSLVAIAATVLYGIYIPEGGGALGRHLYAGLITVMLAVFAHTMTYFYFVGMSSSIKKAVEEFGRGHDELKQARRLKVKVFPWAAVGMLLVMTTFILGGGAHTRAMPSWIHSGLGYLTVAYSLLALLVEGRLLFAQNRLVNQFQRELVQDAVETS